MENSKAGRTPQATTPRSSYKAAWICRSCGHKFKSTVNARSSRGTGCPTCASQRRGAKRQKPPAGKSLGDLAPLVASNWDEDLNGDVTPFDVFPRSEIDRWWKCPKGHVEQTPPKRRVKASFPGGCTVCGGRSVEAGFNDLATTHPQIAAQWDFGRNRESGFDPTTVSAGSERSFWWTCSVGHLSKTQVKSRVRNAGCPECWRSLSSRTEIDLRCEFEAAGIPVDMETRRWRIGGKSFQLDICVPEWTLIIEFDGHHWHEKTVENDRRKTKFLEENGWTVVRMRGDLAPIGDHDVVVNWRVDSLPEMVKKVLRKLHCLGFSTPGTFEYLTGDRLWAEKEANRRASAERDRSLAGEHPELADEFDFSGNGDLRPEHLHPGTNKRVQWRCSICGHDWKASVAARVGSMGKKGTGCPKCSAKRGGERRRVPLAGQSLADLYPDLVLEWDTEKNAKMPKDYRPFSIEKVWWICPKCTSSYQAVISSRTKNGTGCSVCGGKEVLTGRNDLASTHPELLELWDYESNEDAGLFPDEIMAGSAKKAFWLCAKCGTTRQLPIYSVLHGRRHCWDCGKEVRAKKQKIAPRERSLAYLRPDLLKDWDYESNTARGVDPEKTFARSKTRVVWSCHKCGYSWETKVQSRFNGTGCRECNRVEKARKKQSNGEMQTGPKKAFESDG